MLKFIYSFFFITEEKLLLLGVQGKLIFRIYNTLSN
jgi:hypothetical protein